MRNLSTFSVPRCYSPSLPNALQLELHVFTDASQQAMAAVSYWRIVSPTSVQLSFVCGKTRCAPRKPQTIPRLELQAAVMGARMRICILTEHTVKPTLIVMWSDSKTVLLWLKSEARQYKPYVMHRVAGYLSIRRRANGGSCRPNTTQLIRGLDPILIL